MNIEDRMTIMAAFKSFKKRCLTNFSLNVIINIIVIVAIAYLLWGGASGSVLISLFSFLPITIRFYSYIILIVVAIITICFMLKGLLKQSTQVSQAVKYANYKISHPNLIRKDIPVINYYHIRINLPSKH